ncbi:Rhodanese- sulfurtransferase [Phlyctochytrium planicorne]|nr:Rhodanese- sulfurtransferase [Phlyctochytrium planicorne]
MDFDLGNLAVFDMNAVPKWDDDEKAEHVLHGLAHKNAQEIFAKIFSLPLDSNPDGPLAILPKPTTHLPRGKPVPEEKPQTRWEKFAATKGIQKRKKSRMEFNDATQEYKPKFGYKSKGDLDDWLIEVPDRADPTEDQYQKRADEKAEKVRKNNVRQKRNLEERGIVVGESKEAKKLALKSSIVQANKSTASIGKFNKRVEGEEKIKVQRPKRKFDPVTDSGDNERAKFSKVAAAIGKKLEEKEVLNPVQAIRQARPLVELKEKERGKKGGKGAKGAKGGKGGRKL